ncbi:unnamed protein product [Rotaria sordida]|uniref:Uncharacterized protein n=1 Tax=Rotaria sordida TaxID=392033 RepID=A0A815ICY9_9BILA|nr:unnamed protein product [Rotaria sordida]CAF1655525.1 unnamed protein product [Rotaria sordida]
MISLLGIIFFALTPIYSLQYGILLPNEKLSELTTIKNNDQEEKENDKLQLQSFFTKSELMEINKILQHINDTGKNETEAFDENEFSEFNYYNSDSSNTKKIFNIMMKSQFNQFHNDYYNYCLEEQLDMSSFGLPLNHPLVVLVFIVPFYSGIYSIVRDELLNPLLNIDINNETKINELQSSISKLNTTLFLTVMVFNPNEVANTSRPVFHRRDLKLTIHSHELCITDLQLYLSILQQRLNNTKTSSDYMKTLYLQNLNLYNEVKQKYLNCWFFCERLKNEMNSRYEHFKSSIVDAIYNAYELDEVIKEIAKVEQTLDRHCKELDSMKTRFLSDQQQQIAFNNIIKKFDEMYNNLQNVTTHSNNSNYIIYLLFRIQSIIIQLHEIYDIAQENYFRIPPPKPFITNDEIEKIKSKIVQLQFVL